MASGEMDRARIHRLFGQAAEPGRLQCSGSLHYICMDWRHIEELLTAGAEAYANWKNLCVWAKD